MSCTCIYGAHCDPSRADCRLEAGGTLNDGGGVCGPDDREAAYERGYGHGLRDERERAIKAGVFRDGDYVIADDNGICGPVVNIARCPDHGLHGERTECFVCGGPVEQVAMVPVAERDRGEEPS